MQDLTNLSAALLDTLNVVLNGISLTSSPTVVFSGDVDVRELTLNDAQNYPQEWFLTAKGSGYSNDVILRKHRSDSFSGLHAYAVALGLSGSKLSKATTQRFDRITEETRGAIVEQLIQDAGSVVSPEGLLQASDVQLGRRLVIVSIVQRTNSPFAERFTQSLDQELSGYDLETISGGSRKISHASGWSILTKWGCASLPTG